MKEKVYDDQISPLMTQIIELCKANKIAMIADFQLDDEMACTTALLDAAFGPRVAQIKAIQLLKPPQTSFAMAETIETMPDGTKKITLRRIS